MDGRPLGAVAAVGLASLAVLPLTVDSPVSVLSPAFVAAIGLIWGWLTRSRLTVGLITTTTGSVVWFELIRLVPGGHWLVLAALMAWVVWLSPAAAKGWFFPVLVGFLTTELFLILLLWPVNVLSKATVLTAFILLLWQELPRSVPWIQRVQESVLPLVVVTLLMTVTGHWLTF
jgi:hypothetical protein